MQSQSFLIGLGITAFTTVTTLGVSISPTFSQSNSSVTTPEKVTFFCRKVFDSASGERIPATVVWIPERQGHIRFIVWKSEYFNKGGWTPQKRCEEVTQNFQKAYDQGRLNYLSYGKSNGSPIICSLANQGETCNGTNKLFTIISGINPELVLQKLIDIAEGKALEPLLQGSGKQMYISVQDIFTKSALINSKK